MYKWEDEKWSQVHLSAGYSQNTSEFAQPYMVIPANKGKFKVYIEAEGFMAVKSIKGKADGCWAGLVAYDSTKAGWSVAPYVGVRIANQQVNTSFVCGHPDVKLNDCSFKPNRGVECDFICSFELEADDDDAKWILYPPPIQKGDDFNYIVSYSNWTDKWCEWGMVSISIDEVNTPDSVSKENPFRWRRTTRFGEAEGQQPEQINPAEMPSPEELGETSVELQGSPPRVSEAVDRWLSDSDVETYYPPPPPPWVESPVHVSRTGTPKDVRPRALSDDTRSVTSAGTLLGSLRGGILRRKESVPQEAPSPSRFVELDARSDTGSIAGSLTGGSLRGSLTPRLTTAQAREHARISRELGKTAALNYLKSLPGGDQKPP